MSADVGLADEGRLSEEREFFVAEAKAPEVVFELFRLSPGSCPGHELGDDETGGIDKVGLADFFYDGRDGMGYVTITAAQGLYPDGCVYQAASSAGRDLEVERSQ